MKKRIILIASIAISLIFWFSACSGEKTEAGNTESKGEVTVYNWGQYIDESVLDQFEEETGYKVNYRIFTTNEEMYPKVANSAENYDVLIPSDYMIQRLIEENMLLELNMDNIPNFKNIHKSLLGLDFDKKNKYSVPYLWGTVGIIYNETMVDEVPTSWDIMFDKKYEGKILMYDSERDTFMAALVRDGHSMNSTNPEEIEQAKQMLIEQKPLVLAYVVDEVADKMIAGEAALALAWSGEAMLTYNEDNNLKFAIPEEGSNLWIDSMVIPKTSKNKEGAEAFINFMCRDDISKKNMEEVGYTSANINVKDMIDPEWASNIAAYAPDDVLKRCEVFNYSKKNLELISKAWMEVFQE